MTARKPNVLMLSFELPPFNSGGLGEACLGLTKALSDMGYPISFLLPKRLPYPHSYMKLIFADDLIDKSEKNKKEIIKNKNYISTYENKNLKDITHLDYEQTVDLLVKKAEEESFDLIHAHDWMTFEAAVKIKQATGKKLAVQVHSTEVDRSPLDSLDPHKYGLERYGMENADKVITVSKYTKKIVNKFYGIPKEKISVVYNAANIEKTEKLPKLNLEGPIIMYLGRITHQKGPNHFLETAEKVVQKEPTAKFVVVGNGDMYEEMISNAAFKGLSGNIIFTGFLRGIDKEIVLNSCSLFIMPSLSEPFGIVALEAAHFGVPVLVTKQSGAKELLNGALIADFWDTDLMSKQILKAINNKDHTEKLVKTLEEDLKNITWENAAKQCETVYSELIQ